MGNPLTADRLRSAGVVSTVIDAAIAFARGDRRTGPVLLGAAALSTRVSGLGMTVSIALRIYRRLR